MREIRFQWQYKDEKPRSNAEDINETRLKTEEDIEFYIKNLIINDFPEYNIDNLKVLQWEFSDTHNKVWWSSTSDLLETDNQATYSSTPNMSVGEYSAKVDFIQGSELTEVLPGVDTPQEEKIFMKVEDQSAITADELNDLKKAASPFYFTNMFLEKGKFDNALQAYHYGAILTTLMNWNNIQDKTKLVNNIISHAKYLK